MNNKYKDFDAFFKTQEETKEYLTIKLFDTEYQIKSTLPANVFLKLYRSSKKGEDIKASETDQMEIAMGILGESNVAEWCDKGMTLEQLSEIVNWVTEQLMPSQTGNEGKKL